MYKKLDIIIQYVYIISNQNKLCKDVTTSLKYASGSANISFFLNKNRHSQSSKIQYFEGKTTGYKRKNIQVTDDQIEHMVIGIEILWLCTKETRLLDS